KNSATIRTSEQELLERNLAFCRACTATGSGLRRSITTASCRTFGIPSIFFLRRLKREAVAKLVIDWAEEVRRNVSEGEWAGDREARISSARRECNWKDS